MKRYFLQTVLLSILLVSSCKKEQDPPTPANMPNPIILTSDLLENDGTSVKVAGKIVTGQANIIETGVCWSETNSSPTVQGDSSLTQKQVTTVFYATIPNLTLKHSYYYSCFALSNNGNTYYGQTKKFTAGF